MAVYNGFIFNLPYCPTMFQVLFLCILPLLEKVALLEADTVFEPCVGLFFITEVEKYSKLSFTCPANKYMLKVNNINTRKEYEIFSKNNKYVRATSMTLLWGLYCYHWTCVTSFSVVFLWLNFSRSVFTGCLSIKSCLEVSHKNVNDELLLSKIVVLTSVDLLQVRFINGDSLKKTSIFRATILPWHFVAVFAVF